MKQKEKQALMKRSSAAFYRDALDSGLDRGRGAIPIHRPLRPFARSLRSGGVPNSHLKAQSLRWVMLLPIDYRLTFMIEVS